VPSRLRAFHLTASGTAELHLSVKNRTIDQSTKMALEPEPLVHTRRTSVVVPIDFHTHIWLTIRGTRRMTVARFIIHRSGTKCHSKSWRIYTLVDEIGETEKLVTCQGITNEIEMVSCQALPCFLCRISVQCAAIIRQIKLP
jgi:hypothetical protein